VSRTPVTVEEVLGDARGAFLELARQHGDGWGHAWSTGSGLEVQKAPDSALRSAVLADLAANQPAEAALTHLRWATLHLAVRQENTHPFTDGRVAFAHNGSIAPPAALDRLVGPRLAQRPEGDTDSERYFLALLTRMRDREPGAALVRTVADVVASGAEVKSLNCLLLTPGHLYAVCSYDPESDDDPNYYPLLYRRVGHTVVVTSTGWTSGPGWSALGNGEMLVIERGTLATSIVPVATPAQVEQTAAG
jgi:predicted glutamine amidotransferase